MKLRCFDSAYGRRHVRSLLAGTALRKLLREAVAQGIAFAHITNLSRMKGTVIILVSWPIPSAQPPHGQNS